MYGKLQKSTGRLLAEVHLSSWWIKSSALYFNIAVHKLSEIQCWKKLFVIGFPYKHCNYNFWPLCLPVKLAPKTVIRSIPWKGMKPRLANQTKSETLTMFLKSSCLRALRISRQRLFWHIAHILPQDTLWWLVSKNMILSFSVFFIFEKNSKVLKCGQSAFSAQLNAPNNTERRSFRKALKFNQLLLNFTQV